MAELVNINEDCNRLLQGIEYLIERLAVYLNTTISRMYLAIGNSINTEMQYETYFDYGQQIFAIVSQRLTEKFGKGYTYSALPDKQWFIDKLNRFIAIAQQNIRSVDENEFSRMLKVAKRTNKYTT